MFNKKFADDMTDKIEAEIQAREGEIAGIGIPPVTEPVQTPVEPLAPVESEVVRIQAPDGTMAEIPRSSLEKYLKRGATIIQ